MAFPNLKDLSLNELKFLNEDSERLDEFVDSLPIIKEQNKIMEDIMNDIEELAGYIHNLFKIYELLIYEFFFRIEFIKKR